MAVAIIAIVTTISTGAFLFGAIRVLTDIPETLSESRLGESIIRFVPRPPSYRSRRAPFSHDGVVLKFKRS